MAKKKADKNKKKVSKKKATKKKNGKKAPATDVLIVPMPPVEPPPNKAISQDALAMLKDLRSHSLGATLGRCGPSG